METQYQLHMKRQASLRREFATWQPQLRQLAEHLLPRRARWNAWDFNRGDRINDTIINNTPLIKSRALAAALMAAITSPARRWFGLTTPDTKLNQSDGVRTYLHATEDVIRDGLSRSTVYQALADGIYPDLVVFGFSCSLVEEDLKERGIRATPLVLGEYFMATNSKGVVDTIYRDHPMNVRQVVQEFGLPNCSERVKNAYQKGDYETTIEVIQAIVPNEEYTPGRMGREGKRWSSDWFEKWGHPTEEKYLRRKGYDRFPALCPRWSARGNEVYGRSPGMEVLGDSKALQHQEKRLAALVDKTANPPMKGSESMRGGRQSLLSGDMTYVPPGQNQMYEPALVINPAAIVAVKDHTARHEKRIEAGLFSDLLMRVLNDDRPQRATATEIEEGRQEVMLQFGPVLERLNPELLRPIVDLGFYIMDGFGFLPKPPPEVQGMMLDPEFDSILHQAQKAVGLGAVRTLVAEVVNLSQVKPDVVDKLNGDQIVDEIADMAGVKPALVLSNDEVAALRQERARQQQAQAQGQAMLAATQGAKNLGTTPAPSNENALGSILQQLGPIAGGGFGQAGGAA